MTDDSPSHPPPERRPRRRVLRRLAVWTAGLLILLVAAVLIAPKIPGVRQGILARVGTAVESAADVRFTADDFSLSWRRATLELYDIELAVPGESPFLTVARVRAQVQPSSFLGSHWVVREVEVESPHVDLGAPLPESSSGGSSEPSDRTFEISRFVVSDGSVDADPESLADDSWLESWRVDDVGIEGALLSESLRAELSRAVAEGVRREPDAGVDPRFAVELAGRVSGALAGPFEIEELTARGDGLEFSAAGRAGLGEDDPLQAAFELTADPFLWIQGQPGSGGVEAAGDVDLRRWSGEVRWQASRIPAQLVEPWLGRETMDRMGATGSHIDAEGDVGLDSERPRRLTVDADLEWRRGETLLGGVEADVLGLQVGEPGVGLSGEIRAVGSQWRPELLEPWVGSETLELAGVSGTSLDFDTRWLFSEGVAMPEGSMTARWRREARTLADVVVEGQGTGLMLSAELLPASPGARRVDAELRAADWSQLATAEISPGRVSVEIPEIVAALDEFRTLWPGLEIPEIDPSWPVEGALSLAADLSGTVEKPRVDSSLTWRRDGSEVVVIASGDPLAIQGEARLTVEELDLADFGEMAAMPGLRGAAAATADIQGKADDWAASLSLQATDVSADEWPAAIDALELDAGSDETTARLTRFVVRSGGRKVTGDGEAELPWPVERARAAFDVSQPADGIDRVLIEAQLADGTLTLELPEIEAGGDSGELRATVPLGAVREFLGEVPEALAGMPMTEGDVELSFDLPTIDLAALGQEFAIDGLPDEAEVAARGELNVDAANLLASRGSVEIPKLMAVSGEYRLEAGEPVRLTLADGRVETDARRLDFDGRPVAITSTAVLNPAWQSSQPLTELVEHLSADAKGQIDSGLANPYLAGAVASGLLDFEFTASGPPENLEGRAQITGPDAQLVARTPYFTRVEHPEIEVELTDGEVLLNLAKIRVNEGSVELTGFRKEDGDLELFVAFDGVRYRLDYGLGTVLSAKLAVDLPGELLASEGATDKRGRVSGRVTVDRGLLRRDLDFEREIVGQLLEPAVATASGPDDLLAAIDLDIEVVTAAGVRVKNNLADVRATWDPLAVRGHLAAPWIRGRLDVEPGGFAYVLGQTARIDRATVFLDGFPEIPPKLEVDLTTSLEDPSVAREGAGRFEFAGTRPAPTAEEVEDQREQLLAAGIASHYADQLAGRFGSALGGFRIDVAPLLVFGETDPGARLTVSRDLSNQIAFAVSVDLNAENRQTYLLDLHDFGAVPGLTAQIFTNDERHQGVTLQQTFTFGGTEEDADRPRIREIRVELPEGLEVGGIRGASGLGKRDRWPEGAELDVEVDVAEHLRNEGYPGAEIDVRVLPVQDDSGRSDRVDLVIAVEPGPQVTYEFRGDNLPRTTRRRLRGLYRTDVLEPAAIDEMRQEAVRALLALGYPEPSVEVTKIAAEPAEPAGDRTVIVDVAAGEKRPIAHLELRGLPEEVAAEVGAAFASRGDRIGLAKAAEASDGRLLGLMRRLGYPDAGISARRLADDGERLVVELDPGRRVRIAEIRLEGEVAESDPARWMALLPIAPGDPARSDRVARGTLVLENDLRRQGYVDARVRAVVSPRDGDEIDLTYQLEAGTRYEIRDIRFDGAEATRSRWAERVADLDKGAPVDPDEVGDARRQLFETGLFHSVVPETERGPDGDATVVFDLRERPRFQLAYGLRWESSEGVGVVVDGVDRNAFGRGVSLGLRGLWSDDEKSIRAYSAFPKVFGSPLLLELFAEQSQSRQEGRTTDRTESTIQVSRSLGDFTTARWYVRWRDSRFEEPDDEGGLTRLRDPIFGWQWLRDTRNDKIDATRGLLTSVDLTGADDFLGGDSRFLRLFTKLSAFHEVARRDTGPVTWAQSWRLGWAEAFGDQELSPDERFFAGGELSVRGYGNDSLGQLSSSGTPFGGEALFVVNQELRFPVWGIVRGLVFLDAGNVWEDSGDLDSDFFTSAGLGLRLSTPVGLVRFDAALPLDRRQDDDEVTFYVGLGNVF